MSEDWNPAIIDEEWDEFMVCSPPLTVLLTQHSFFSLPKQVWCAVAALPVDTDAITAACFADVLAEAEEGDEMVPILFKGATRQEASARLKTFLFSRYDERDRHA